ncbi:putative flavoprotein involved in K+ transport [Georgenia satyanarayanai]|uniref:Putative flavoprotein involved in K+ transport n=1 Tax=Georgenia satyanarayanai TaxID=860221 RepID=A0A2Y9AEU2_9MICO|nr:NAD(P)/FAD-dependent oxidoreductase [Georgenia satyanarayanai]PYF99816.1 putative flavoprotein involved in K+ transport [Georgenia satyanarayanai]SSA41798.1 putative flavoprotein involved in K+ transport [Georgenia satyanarayanai]
MDHTIVIGAGQAGLVAGYHLARRGLPFTVLEADDRVGGGWNHRWDTMRMFTPAGSLGLPGMPFPSDELFPSGAQMAAYLSTYAERVGMDIRTGVAVDGLFRDGDRFQVTAGAATLTAANVVLATGAERVPNVPALARRLSSGIVQLHSVDYRNPAQLQPGGVAVVGAANSGADIALELAATHDVVLCGRHPGHVPLRIESKAMLTVFPLIALTWNHVLTRDTPPGRRSREKLLSGHGTPLIRVKPRDLADAGVRRAARVTDVVEGLPVTAVGEVLDVANVVWATGFLPGHDWIELPGLDSSGFLDNDRGAVTGQPGLYVLGQLFQHRFSSHNSFGVVPDAELVVGDIARRAHRAGASVRP